MVVCLVYHQESFPKDEESRIWRECSSCDEIEKHITYFVKKFIECDCPMMLCALNVMAAVMDQ